MRLRSVLIGCVALVGCAESVDSVSGSYDREVRGGRSHDQPLMGSAERLALSELVAAAPPLREAVGELDDRDFTVTAYRSATRSGQPLTSVFAQQSVSGVPIRGAYVYLATQRGAGGDRLVASSYHLYQGAQVGTAPGIGRDRAIAEGRGRLRVDSAAVVDADLAIWPLDGRLTLVWEITVPGQVGQALVVAAGPDVGRVELRDDRVYDSAGTVRGWVAVGGAPGGQGTPTALPLPATDVTSGGASALTAADGHYQIAAPEGGTIATTLAGTASVVTSSGGPTLTVSAPAAPTVDLTLGTGSGENALAQVTAHYFTTRTRQFLEDNGIPASSFGAPLAVNANLNDTCNAYFSPGARTINFFRSGGGCQNSAEATIIAHEYGHFIDHALGGITNGGLSEGWGDVVSCLLTKDPVVGGDLLPNGEIIRTCDNDYQYPPGGYDEVHALGQAWAGFVWHARANLVAALGAEAGDALARQLVLPSLPSNAPTIPDAVREVFLRDDDDGDLSNHTPHWAPLLAAANQHGLGFVVDTDLSAPSAVTDLEIAAATATQVTVRWTAPGDDGDQGTAAHYDLRWSTQAITEATFAAANPALAPTPGPAGTTQETTVSVPPSATIYLALKTSDELGNTSTLSNVATAALPAPTVVFADGGEHGLGEWQATGLWHVTQRKAAEGAASFWYGSEATGNYDTGAPNAGTLLSPVIDLAGVAHPKLAYDEWAWVESDPYDKMTVEIFDVDEPAISVVAGKLTPYTGGAFTARLIDLNGLAGRRIQIRFRFDTVDSAYNGSEGWFIDRLTVFGDGPATPAVTLLVNEVLADPPSNFDANGDGVFSIRGDEMIEFINTGTAPLDLGGVTIADAVAVRATLPAGTVLAPGQALVVYGGTAPTLPGVVTVATSGLYLNNSGDHIVVRRPDGAIVTELAYGREGGSDQSLVREVDADPASPIVGHKSVATAPASPGTRSDGSPFGDEPPAPAQLLVNEVLADPPSTYDANGDGVASTVADEFVELVNLGGVPLDLSGATLADATQVRGTFAVGTVIAPGKALVVFGGGAPNLPGIATVVFAPLQLNNGGDTITIRGVGGAVLAEVAFGASGGMDQSLTRATDGDPDAEMVLHGSVSPAVASPGRRVDGLPW